MADVYGTIRDFGGVSDDDPIIHGGVSFDDPIIENPQSEVAHQTDPVQAAGTPKEIVSEIVVEYTPAQPASVVSSEQQGFVPAAQVANDVSVNNLTNEDETVTDAQLAPQSVAAEVPVSVAEPATMPEITPAQAAAAASLDPLAGQNPTVDAQVTNTQAQMPSPQETAPKESARGRKNYLGIVAVLVVVLIVAASGWWWFARQQTKETVPDLVADYQLKSSDTPMLGKCRPVVDTALRASVDDFARAIESDAYEVTPITDEHKQTFDFFQRYSLGTGAQHCFALEYCQNHFAANLPFDLAFARQAYIEKNYGAGATVDVLGDGFWQPASRLRADVQDYFGVADAELGFLPVLSGQTINDVYNGNSDTFLALVNPVYPGPYHYQLVEMRQHRQTGQRIFVAVSVNDKQDCSVTLGGEQCACPSARYYLVQDLSPATSKPIFTHEYVQVIDK